MSNDKRIPDHPATQVAESNTSVDQSLIRVVHVIDSLNVGGAEMLLPEFCRYEDAASVQSTVIALRQGTGTKIADTLEELGVKVEIIASDKRRQLLDLKRIGRLRNRFNSCDYYLVHTHLRVATIFGGIAGRWAGLPVVTTLHNVRRDIGTGVVNRIKDILETMVLRRTVAIAIACGPTVAESNADRVGNTVQATVANPVGVVPTITDQLRDELRQQFLGGSDGPLFMAVGRLTSQKGFDVLIDAFADVVEKIPGARLIIVGQGEDAPSLQSQITRLGLGERITLTGVRDDVPALLRSIDVFVMPSRWEGLPIALLEAMAAECNIVATTVGDIVWTAGDTAQLVESESPAALADGLLTLASDLQAGRELGRRARLRTEQRHSPVVWVRSLRKVYEEAIARSRS